MPEKKSQQKAIALWLLAGVFMLMIQVSLGGITRLTDSGLSITEWKPILGTLPPLNDQQWTEAFEKYKQIAQFKQLHFYFTIRDFKSIYFWEWLHRNWAKFIAVAFIIPFVIFLSKKMIKPQMIKPLIILFLLGGLQGLAGWLMVKSGLNDENIYVSHYRLAIHFILALVLIVYAFWFVLDLSMKKEQIFVNLSLKKFTGWIIFILVLQLIYGAFMAGLKAGTFAATWPDINGHFLPHGGSPSSGSSQIFDNPITVQFIHRSLAYMITLLIFTWWMQVRKMNTKPFFKKINHLPLIIVLLQVLLGILTVLQSPYKNTLLWLGTAHQFVAMLLLIALVWNFYLLSKRIHAN